MNEWDKPLSFEDIKKAHNVTSKLYFEYDCMNKNFAEILKKELEKDNENFDVVETFKNYLAIIKRVEIIYSKYTQQNKQINS